jgi:hypothetical protein
MGASSVLRALVALGVAIATALFVFATVAGITGSWQAGIVVGALAAVGVGVLGFKRPVVQLDAAASSRGLAILSGLATVVALVQLVRMTVFMATPARVGYSVLPSSDFELHHSCMSAYYVAARAADTASSVYDGSLYNLPSANPAAPRKPRMLGFFRIDVYEYPPPFLLVPRALGVVAPDFLRFRLLWFGLTTGVVLLAMLITARALRPAAGTRALLLSPIVWAALPTLSAVQKGNAQLLVLALAMLAMVLFQQRRWAAGGALLAWATVSKLFPGMLIVYLLARRQWRPAIWTAAFGALFALATFIDLGRAPYVAFLDHLPGLLGGEAFPALRNPPTIAINFSMPGLAFKLKLFGLAGMSYGAAKVIGWVYTAIVVWVVIVIGRRPIDEGEAPLAWMAILVLATLRSPFLPQAYAAFAPLWLLTLLAATAAPTARTLALVVLTWLGLNVFWPLDWPMDPRLLALLNTIPQGITIALAVLALRHVRGYPPARFISSQEGTGRSLTR